MAPLPFSNFQHMFAVLLLPAFRLHLARFTGAMTSLNNAGSAALPVMPRHPDDRTAEVLFAARYRVLTSLLLKEPISSFPPFNASRGFRVAARSYSATISPDFVAVQRRGCALH